MKNKKHNTLWWSAYSKAAKRLYFLNVFLPNIRKWLKSRHVFEHPTQKKKKDTIEKKEKKTYTRKKKKAHKNTGYFIEFFVKFSGQTLKTMKQNWGRKKYIQVEPVRKYLNA